MRVPKTDHISPHLVSLHWLPTDSPMQYKFASLCYNCLNSTSPGYLTELLKVCKPTRQIRSSSDTSILCLNSAYTHSLGQRSFSYAAPSLWNSLSCKAVIKHTCIFQIIFEILPLQTILLTQRACMKK